ncbi:hypothetical protein ACF1AB_39125 [Streptomyces sp. NPDC014846]|uniref:hypothetical protein n=1 Tax=Streptomyces sp. NPDC014846 TaxID=3364922 RepID=UPI003702387E
MNVREFAIRLKGAVDGDELRSLLERLRTDELTRHLPSRLREQGAELVAVVYSAADVRPVVRVISAWLDSHPTVTVFVAGHRLPAMSSEEYVDRLVSRLLEAYEHPPLYEAPVQGAAERAQPPPTAASPPGPPFDDDDDEW